jgi:ketosteroid isomerase-like protein
LSEPPAAAPASPDDDAVQGFVDAFNAGDLDGQLRLAAPDLVLCTATEWPGGGEYRGLERARRALSEFVETWDEIRYERLAGEVVAGHIVERARWVGRGRASGIESAVDFYTAWTVRDGLVARIDLFARRDQAREFARSFAG